MPPVDNKEIDTAQIWLSFVHRYVKEKSKKQEESFSGDLQGRTLGFIGKEFKKFIIENSNENFNLQLFKPLYHSLISFFSNSYNPFIKDD